MLKTEFILKILNNYFWIVILATIVMLLTGKGYIISIFFPCVLFFLAWKSGLGRKGYLDISFLLIVLSMFFSWATNSYANKGTLIFRTIMAEGAYMAAYFIGKKYGSYCLTEIFKKALFPLIICSLVGIYLFYRPTGWYLQQLYDSEFYEGGALSLESLRLRSIFSSPYVMSYMCGLTSIWLMFRIFRDEQKEIKNYLFLALFIITMMLCMMRAPLSCVVIAFVLSLLYNSIYKGNFKTMIKTLLLVVVIIWGISLITQSMGNDSLKYLMEKFQTATTGRNELISDRVSMWNYKYYLLGDGAGRHSMLADQINAGTSIRDSEYVKILVEQGYLGLTFYIIFLSLCVLKCIRHFRNLSLEFCILLFYIITMIGANSLSASDKHCFIFWLVAGRIAAFQKNHYQGILK